MNDKKTGAKFVTEHVVKDLTDAGESIEFVTVGCVEALSDNQFHTTTSVTLGIKNKYVEQSAASWSALLAKLMIAADREPKKIITIGAVGQKLSERVVGTHKIDDDSRKIWAVAIVSLRGEGGSSGVRADLMYSDDGLAEHLNLLGWAVEAYWQAFIRRAPESFGKLNAILLEEKERTPWLH